MTAEGDRRDQGGSPSERRGKPPWWLVGTQSSGFARFCAWLWLVFAGLATVQLVTTDDYVVRWIAACQIVIGLSLCASYLGSITYTRRAEEHKLLQQ